MMSGTRRAIPWVVFVLGGTVAVVFIEGPSHSLWWDAVFEAGHAPLFGLIALGLRALLSGSRRMKGRRPPVDVWAFSGALAIGAITELAQIPGPRDADLRDLARDGLGALAFLVVRATLSRRVPWPRALLGWCLGLGLLVPVAWPVAVVGHAYHRRDRAFPMLASFDHPWERVFVSGGSARIERVRPPEGWTSTSGARVGRLELHPARYTGLQIVEPYPDWRGYQELVLDLYSGLSRPVTLHLRANDHRHDQTYADRFNLEWELEPGAHALRVPLSAVREGPVERRLDMAGIQNLTLFVVNPADTLVLHLDSIRLE